MKTVLILLFLIYFLCPAPALADAGIPMLVVVWPAAWVLLVPIVIIESMVAKRIFNTTFLSGLKIAGLANTVSTLVGIPFTWLILFVLQNISGATKAWGIDTFVQKLLAVTVQSPWLIPYPNAPNWFLPAAATSLCLCFYVMSIILEVFVVKLYARGALESRAIVKWSMLANTASYSCVFLALVAMVLKDFFVL